MRLLVLQTEFYKFQKECQFCISFSLMWCQQFATWSSSPPKQKRKFTRRPGQKDKQVQVNNEPQQQRGAEDNIIRSPETT